MSSCNVENTAGSDGKLLDDNRTEGEKTSKGDDNEVGCEAQKAEASLKESDISEANSSVIIREDSEQNKKEENLSREKETDSLGDAENSDTKKIDDEQTLKDSVGALLTTIESLEEAKSISQKTENDANISIAAIIDEKETVLDKIAEAVTEQEAQPNIGEETDQETKEKIEQEIKTNSTDKVAQDNNTEEIDDVSEKIETKEHSTIVDGEKESIIKAETQLRSYPILSIEKENELDTDKEQDTETNKENAEKLSDAATTKLDDPMSTCENRSMEVEKTKNIDLTVEEFKEPINVELNINQNILTDDANELKIQDSSQDSSKLVIDETPVVDETNITKSCEVIELKDDIDDNAAIKNIAGLESTVNMDNSLQKSNANGTTDDVIEIDDEDDDELHDKKPKFSMTEETAPNEKEKEEHEEARAIKSTKSELSVSIGCAKMHTMPMIFYNKECINFECSKNNKEFHRAPQFALNYFKVTKKKVKVQYICGECYDAALDFYRSLCGMLDAKQPIFLRDITSKKQEFVEILDSSDEEDGSTIDTENKEKENSSFSKADLHLIETELENSIRSIFNRVEIQNQLTWSKTIFTERVQKLQDELSFIDEELREQQKLADKMYNNLYESGKYRINTLKPLDLDNDVTDQIPPYGEIERTPIKLGELYYAAKHKAISCWIPCRVIEQLDANQVILQKSAPNYRVKFINSQYQTFKSLSAKLIAYYDPPNVRLSVGQRVIAYFDGSTLSPRDKDKNLVQSAFYPGIIAEEMKPNNFFRYLIFYDDGYTQYVSCKDVRLVCHVARNVWEDVDPSSREFIQKYVMEYRVNRPMVQTHKGQKMATESNGRWVPARVIDIDCSLVRMQFEGPNKNHKEWIYRGSLRLNPVYMEYQKSKTSQANQMPISRLPRRTEPFIRYTEDEECIRGSLGTQQQQQQPQQQQQQEQEQQQQQQQQRNVNRADSVGAANQQPTKVRHLNTTTIYLEDENKPKGKVIYYTAKRQLQTKTYRPHKCGPDCLIVVPHNLNGYSPLAKPLLSGWERIFLRQKSKKRVFYRGPCGKSLRDMKEVHQYLRLTKNTLNVDNFDFYIETSCLAEFEAENINLRKRDISNGQEKMPLPLVNYYDESLPECTYSAKVIPTEGVNINTDPSFLICCDCEDDCVDKEKCACWQLTIEGVKSINPDAHIDDIGYQYKRLYEHLPTGIYECNSRCKCKSHCINRVVQHSLEMKLQVFKTSNRGWGLRCLNDVPRGSFVCIYAGNLLTESKANEGGLDAGDEYFAELDYIETVEQLKEGYESDVETQEDEEEEDSYMPDDDDDFRPGKSFVSRSKRSQRQLSAEGERQAINFNPNVEMEDDTKKRRASVRQFFGKEEAVYVMDAKVTGNLGRYFNHSCSPNLFVQNVFVDTHDVRFPWVAFFSLTHIRAGTELTWNYNYEVGVVPGKVLYCQCGATNCRQRLL